MKKLEYTVSFTTPAFLGNAEQQAQWRTPPFKALIRQWWRVVFAAKNRFRFSISDMRHEEGRLFGHAWLEDDLSADGRKVAARQSSVRLRLSPVPGSNVSYWAQGSQLGIAPVQPVLANSYAWFGLVRRGAGLPDRTAVKAGGAEASQVLRLGVPEQQSSDIEETLRLIHEFGQVGSRSRGGWGSVMLSSSEHGLRPFEVARYVRPLADCLTADWAMSLACDENGSPWIWESREPVGSWGQVLPGLAAERKRVRSALRLQQLDLRPILGFAAGTARLASALRWKLVADSSATLRVRVFAMPNAIPATARKDFRSEHLAQAWTTIRNALDTSEFVIRQKVMSSPRDGSYE